MPKVHNMKGLGKHFRTKSFSKVPKMKGLGKYVCPKCFSTFKQQPEGPLTEDPSTQESDHDSGRFFITEATIKIKHFRRRAHLNEETHVFATIKQLLHGENGSGTEKVPQRTFATKISPNFRVNFLMQFASKPLMGNDR